MATLRDALHELACTLGRTPEGVDAIAGQAEHLRAGIEALGALRQCEDTAVGRDMVVDAVDVLAAFRELASGILDGQAEVDTLEEERADDDDRDAWAGATSIPDRTSLPG